MFEHRSAPILPPHHFALRLVRTGGIAACIIAGSLFLGTLGYHLTENLPWIDATLNASMILSGMGPLHNPSTTAGKLFATGYALFSGIAFLTLAAVLFAPVLHRLLHSFHLEMEDEEADTDGKPRRKPRGRAPQ
jgi:hypothetical protein